MRVNAEDEPQTKNVCSWQEKMTWSSFFISRFDSDSSENIFPLKNTFRDLKNKPFSWASREGETQIAEDVFLDMKSLQFHCCLCGSLFLCRYSERNLFRPHGGTAYFWLIHLCIYIYIFSVTLRRWEGILSILKCLTSWIKFSIAGKQGRQG